MSDTKNLLSDGMVLGVLFSVAIAGIFLLIADKGHHRTCREAMLTLPADGYAILKDKKVCP